MLVTLLVLWVVVIPLLTLAGTHLLSIGLARHGTAMPERPTGPVDSVGVRRRAPIRTRDHAGRPRGHTLIKR